MSSQPRLELAYRVLSGDDSDERSCAAIPAAACTELPANFILNAANGAATKLAEQIAGSKLVLPWLIGALGAPTWLAGLLVPVKQAGSLLPQLAAAARIRALRQRKWAWCAAGLFQALCLLGMAAAAAFAPATAAGLLLIGLLALFSIASGIGSLAFQDVTGKTVPEGRRGRLLASRAMLGGGLALLAGLLLRSEIGEQAELSVYLGLLLGAAALWAIAAVLFGLIREPPGASEGGHDMSSALRDALSLLRNEAGYRRFLIARCLLLSVELAAPFYVLYGRQQIASSGVGDLGVLLVAVSLASLVSSRIWGGFADTSSRRVMIGSASIAAAAAGAALAFPLLPPTLRNIYCYALIFVALGVAEAGVRLGRKTYLIDAVPAEQQVLYVALTNTVSGVLAFAGAALGLLAQHFGLASLIAVLAALGVFAAAAAVRMPEATQMSGGRA